MSEFLLYPAIDLRNGQAVRLYKGDYDQMTVYDNDPASVAVRFKEAGAKFLHVVDLDGAKEGSQQNRPVIEAIVKATGLPVQVGGGIRNGETLEALFSLGVQRAILGTAAVNEPEFVRAALQEYGEKIAIGIDAKDGMVAVNGWLETSTITAIDLGRELKGAGATRVIFTDISRDGTLTGPNIPAIVEMAEKTGLGVIASGGIKDTNDLLELATYRGRGVIGSIIGKAIYNGNIELVDAIREVNGAIGVTSTTTGSTEGRA
ncbi:1-(5-phosphoribosyl)-5-[(5-phosphoribosylamino)methylideneamino]imidazole-4-carboxamide isomerase [Tumebacillus permanentifrigoris]|uniref:1-(5-phosphoribosyl)-5-[(5-phosphoribosylamino)methylideneamino] imidazole-4-carboxamide isomerase n=1 Tax=Tumebacillus permanentifrigoris TaxID=378543 RepID=A0A316DAT4_9BACL|nr:1-(5-phosphoribosyl)-5-[(5-phosphoribosylamino)methylideneamino]imidazole-4-carboxamide isomerase [Tumebacillus permanentifrigoris]PWK13011.1 1-(5-phosphoribosyl)-5-[(5-phosphoribosylamino)methylideneamino] imidazole-4-carboxamide isomerase [Tumebacillus permanentifrigoris]